MRANLDENLYINALCCGVWTLWLLYKGNMHFEGGKEGGW